MSNIQFYALSGDTCRHGDIESNSTRVLVVNHAFHDKHEVFEWYAGRLYFPNWFGRNWNAFRDILSDLDTMFPEQFNTFILLHRAYPLLPEKDLYVYINILNDLVGIWKEPPERLKRDFTVLFPKHDEEKIREVLSRIDNV